MKSCILIAFFALGLCAHSLADEKPAYPHIAFVGPGSGNKAVSRDQLVLLVVEGPYISCEGQPVPSNGTIDYIDSLLKNKNVSYLGVYSRAGIKYGDVVRALDVLRKTSAKEIGVSLVELPVGRDP
jgi:hypothetical protein